MSDIYIGFIGGLVAGLLGLIGNILVSRKSISSHEKITTKTIDHQLFTENYRLKYEFWAKLYIMKQKCIAQMQEILNSTGGDLTNKQFLDINALSMEVYGNIIATSAYVKTGK